MTQPEGGKELVWSELVTKGCYLRKQHGDGPFARAEVKNAPGVSFYNKDRKIISLAKCYLKSKR